jgi:hypothetical protein
VGLVNNSSSNVSVQVREADTDVDAGIEVIWGDQITFTASGEIWAGVILTLPNGPDGWVGWAAGDDFPLPGANVYGLLARVGSTADAPYFFVGSGMVGYYRPPQTTDSARIWLRINDNEPGNGSGSFDCNIQVSPAVAKLKDTFGDP